MSCALQFEELRAALLGLFRVSGCVPCRLGFFFIRKRLPWTLMVRSFQQCLLQRRPNVRGAGSWVFHMLVLASFPVCHAPSILLLLYTIPIKKLRRTSTLSRAPAPAHVIYLSPVSPNLTPVVGLPFEPPPPCCSHLPPPRPPPRRHLRAPRPLPRPR